MKLETLKTLLANRKMQDALLSTRNSILMTLMFITLTLIKLPKLYQFIQLQMHFTL